MPEVILCVCVYITLDTMLNFDGNTNVTCEQTLMSVCIYRVVEKAINSAISQHLFGENSLSSFSSDDASDVNSKSSLTVVLPHSGHQVQEYTRYPLQRTA